MYIWKAKILIDGIPRDMTTNADNQMVARTYFETFGKILNGPRIIG